MRRACLLLYAQGLMPPIKWQAVSSFWITDIAWMLANNYDALEADGNGARSSGFGASFITGPPRPAWHISDFVLTGP